MIFLPMKLPALTWVPTHSLMWIVLGKRNPVVLKHATHQVICAILGYKVPHFTA